MKKKPYKVTPKNFKKLGYISKNWTLKTSGKRVPLNSEDWFMSWTNKADPNLSIEITRFLCDEEDEDGNITGEDAYLDYEVWEQVKVDDGSWDGQNIDVVYTKKEAIACAKKYLKKFKGVTAKQKLCNDFEKAINKRHR